MSLSKWHTIFLRWLLASSAYKIKVPGGEGGQEEGTEEECARVVSCVPAECRAYQNTAGGTGHMSLLSLQAEAARTGVVSGAF